MSRPKKDNPLSSEAPVDVDFTIKPKKLASHVNKLYGKPQTHFEAPKQRWEDMEAIYQESAKGIVETAINVNSVINMPGVRENVPDPSELKVAIKGLTRDLETFTATLTKIHDTHKGKTGVITNPHEHAQCLATFDEYINFATQFKAVTLPTVLTIMDQVGSAAVALNKQHLQDHPVVAVETAPVADATVDQPTA